MAPYARLVEIQARVRIDDYQESHLFERYLGRIVVLGVAAHDDAIEAASLTQCERSAGYQTPWGSPAAG